MPRRPDPVAVGDLTLLDRLNRAPLLESVGNGPGAVETLIRELETAAAAAAGLIHQGGTIVTGAGGCDPVGMARPFYAEPRLPARLLRDGAATAACESCNSCVVPRVAGARGVCRTPSVLRARGAHERAGAYDGPRDP